MKNTSPCPKKQDTMYQCEVANEKAQEALMRSPFFFLLGWGGVGLDGKGDFCFFHCSQYVLIMFSWGFQKVPQDVPNFTSDLSLMVCPKFNNHVNKLKKVGGPWGSIIVSILQLKRCFYLGVPNVPKKIDDGPINMAP
jgi:hypothetical protein